MARGGVDGSITIDTKVDEKGFNTGIANISKSFDTIGKSIGGKLGKVFKTLGGVTAVLGTAAAIIGVIIGAVVILAVAAVGAGIAIYKWAQKTTNALYQNLSATSAFRSQVVALKQGFDSVKGSMMGVGATLLSIIAPAIQKVVSWLVTAINLVNQFIAALAGKTSYMKYVSGSADAASKSTGSAAKNSDKLAASTKKAGKEAKGALAAFDEINVLQKKTAELSDDLGGTSGGGGGSAAGGNVMMEEVAIDSKISGMIEKVQIAWTKVKETLTPVWEWIKTNVIDPIWSNIEWLWNIISESASQLWNGGLEDVFNTFITFIKNFFLGNLQSGFNTVVNIFKTVLVAVTGVINSVIQIIGGIIQFITGVFTGDWEKAWEGVKNIFKGVFNGVAFIVEGVVNAVIDLINGMIDGVISGVNAVIKALNTIKIDIPAMFGKPAFTWGINLETLTAPKIQQVEIPKLATGAVIPANAPFAAILGDQKHGTNIEAPADLIRQIVREETQNMTNGVTVNFTGTMAALIQAMKPEIDRENKRIGGSLIAGA